MIKLLGVALLSALGVKLFGQASGGATPSDPWVLVLQWGPAGTVLVLLASGQLRFGREMKAAEERLKDERDARIKAENDRDLVNTKAASDFIPLLTEATHLLSDFRPKTSPDRAVATALAAIAEKLEEIDRK